MERTALILVAAMSACAPSAQTASSSKTEQHDDHTTPDLQSDGGPSTERTIYAGPTANDRAIRESSLDASDSVAMPAKRDSDAALPSSSGASALGEALKNASLEAARAAPFDGSHSYSSPFSSISVQSCKAANGPTGSGHVTVTFAPSGEVVAAVVDSSPFKGTPVGDWARPTK
jgi:hypothetical protein